MALSDDELVARIGRGDQHAFSQLFERHGGKVLGYATRLLGDRAAAEDLAQEVWMKVIRLAPSYQSQGHFIAWVYTMTRNASFNVLRGQKRFVESQEIELETPELPDRQGLEEQMIHMGEIKEVIREMDALPDMQRLALVTWLTEDMSYEDLAQHLQTSVSAVKSLLFRARQHLQQKLQRGTP